MSEFGREVADILGQVWRGIYHLDHTKLKLFDPRLAEVTIRGELATWDYTYLTDLVVLCHDRCVRLAISGARNGILRLRFWPRDRKSTDSICRFHPTMEESVARVRSRLGLGVIDG